MNPSDPLLLRSQSRDQWTRFFEGTSVRGPLGRAWNRALTLGASPDVERAEAVVDAGSLHERRTRLGELVACSDEVLSKIAKRFDSAHHLLLLCDLDGVVLKRWGGGQFAATADEVHLIEGSMWNEAERGTNAIGTALAEGRGVICEGSAHFTRANHQLACYAQLVRDLHGEPLALLDATSHISQHSAHLAHALFAAARELELAFAHRALRARPELLTLTRLIAHSQTASVLLRQDNAPIFVNKAARILLDDNAVDWGALTRDPMGTSSVSTPVGSCQISCESVDDLLLVELRPDVTSTRPTAVRPKPPLTTGLPDAFATLHGEDPHVRDTLFTANRFADTPLPALLLAETGTGKELLARALHEASSRRAGPFVALNCGAFAPNLVESELFGYAEGAFTGARRGGQPGKLEQAAGGTLFLDEVAELPPRVQAALLRFLEDGTFFRVGGTQPERVDLRFVCATCRDLPALVEDGAFRSDLYYRIRGVTLSLPPLRERSDLEGLAAALLDDLVTAATTSSGADRVAPTISPAALARLRQHPWPGNIRELKHALHHALVLADDVIEPEHLPQLEDPRGPAGSSFPPRAARNGLADAEADALRAAVARAQGNMSAAARELGIARSTLYRKAAKLGIKLS